MAPTPLAGHAPTTPVCHKPIPPPPPVPKPLIQLRPPSHDIRTDRDEAFIEKLTTEIRRVGFLGAITAFALVEPDAYEVVAGYTRVLAAIRAGLTHIPVIVLPEPPDAAEALRLRLMENELRDDLDVLERATAIQNYMTHRGITAQQAADELCMSVANVCKILSIGNRLCNELRPLISSAVLQAGIAYHVSRLPTPELQIEIARGAIASKLNAKQVEAIVRDKLRESPAAGRAKQTMTQKIPVESIDQAMEWATALIQKLKGLKANPTTQAVGGSMLAKLLEGGKF